MCFAPRGVGFAVVDGDDAFFIHCTIRPKIPVSARGADNRPYAGSYKRIVIYEAVVRDGRQFFRTR